LLGFVLAFFSKLFCNGTLVLELQDWFLAWGIVQHIF
jgi:hypothetical protein